MSYWQLVEQFSLAAAAAPGAAELFALLEAAARELGFRKVALVHGLWFRFPGHRLIRMDNFGDWARIFIAEGYYHDDPALLACQRTNRGFAWSALPDLVPYTHRQEKIVREAAKHGLRSGFTLPVGVVGEPHGCCSFVSSRAALPSRRRCRVASLIGAEAFHEARRIHGFPARAATLPKLSRRKLECLRYAAIGKSAGEIATILALSESTVRTYLAMLRRDFDVVSRAQLVAAALRFGLIGFDDATGPF